MDSRLRGDDGKLQYQRNIQTQPIGLYGSWPSFGTDDCAVKVAKFSGFGLSGSLWRRIFDVADCEGTGFTPSLMASCPMMKEMARVASVGFSRALRQYKYRLIEKIRPFKQIVTKYLGI